MQHSKLKKSIKLIKFTPKIILKEIDKWYNMQYDIKIK